MAIEVCLKQSNQISFPLKYIELKFLHLIKKTLLISLIFLLIFTHFSESRSISVATTFFLQILFITKASKPVPAPKSEKI